MRSMEPDGEEEGLAALKLAKPFDVRLGEDALDEVIVIAAYLLPTEAVFFSSLHLSQALTARRDWPLALERCAEIPTLRVIHVSQAIALLPVEPERVIWRSDGGE